MKVQINKLGWGSVWSFRPCSDEAETKMRKLFRASWVDGVMFVEHRYEVETAERLQRVGFVLTREDDDVEIEVKDGRFVVKRRAA